MLRRLLRWRLPLRRRFSSQAPSDTSPPHHHRHLRELCPPPPPPPPLPLPCNPIASPTPSPSSPPLPLYAFAGTLISSLAVAAYVFTSTSSPSERSSPIPDQIYSDLEQTLERSKGSVRRVLERMRQTGAAAAVLWRSLFSVLSSANQEVRLGFELRVAALIADIAAANAVRREAIVGAGGGAVVDWLLESVSGAGSGGEQCGTQVEAARALAHLIADPDTCAAVLGRPRAVPNLLRFIFSFQPKRPKKNFKHSSLDGSDHYSGRSMLVAALLDIVTSNCDSIDHSFRSLLPGNADMRDIAAAIEVIEHGGMQFDDRNSNNDDDDGDTGIKGIGIKVLGGTTIMGFSGGNIISESQKPEYELELAAYNSRELLLQESVVSYPKVEKLTSGTVPGLWDDLQREHVAVPFATWALANWALASNVNRAHIQELDSDGHAVMTALTASERTVKWHGSLVAHALLADQNLPLTLSVPDWSSSLLSTAFQATRNEDISLAQLALSVFRISIERCKESKMVVREKGLDLMREISKLMEKQKDLQELISSVLDLLYTKDSPLSLEECQRWSGILLRWIFGQFQSETTQLTAIKILSRILEDNGPASIPISQGWLTMLLTEVLTFYKTSNSKGSTPPKPDKVKNQIEQSNIYLATQVANELATAVIKLAGIRSEDELEPESSDKLPLADFLSFEPFIAPLKSLKKSNLPKFDAADSALATLKAIKALAEVCSEDAACQHKISHFGVLFLLRRLLLGDDYEKLAANEAYDASRVLETQERNSAASGDSSSPNLSDPSTVRVPPTMHLRRHAARLLTILSLLPSTRKTIAGDEIWCKWLEDCAIGRIPCNDVKLQSYCRSTLLNIFCPEMVDMEGVSGEYPNTDEEYKRKCPQYGDRLFFLNPELPCYITSVKNNLGSVDSHSSIPLNSKECVESENSNSSSSLTEGEVTPKPTATLLDVVFVHGIRGGPFNSWRIADNKSSTTSKAGLVESIDQEAGKEGTCWPREWLPADFPHARFFTVKYKTNLTQWSGASLPLQEVSSMLLRKLIVAGIGCRPVVFITHSMGGLVVKQMLYQAKLNNFNKLLNNTVGIVFYSCPHFGSKLADVPWRMGLVFRPAPSIGELRSGSPRLVELNDFIRHLNSKGVLEVLSFSETKVTPIVEGYGGWALRMEIVPIESAYPGYGELVVLDATDHINSCKPVNRTDPSYSETLEFLKKLLPRLT